MRTSVFFSVLFYFSFSFLFSPSEFLSFFCFPRKPLPRAAPYPRTEFRESEGAREREQSQFSSPPPPPECNERRKNKNKAKSPETR